MVLGAIERGGRVAFWVSSKARANRSELHQFVASSWPTMPRRSTPTRTTGYQGIGTDERPHETVSHQRRNGFAAIVSTQSIESVWSLLDRSIIGSYHQLSAKHLSAYLDEISFRFNNRENPFLFRDTLIALVNADPLTYWDLTTRVGEKAAASSLQSVPLHKRVQALQPSSRALARCRRSRCP